MDTTSIPKTRNSLSTSSSGDAASGGTKECFVCCRDIVLYAVGGCDHPVCHVCSTRLRVLCKTNECPVCRTVIPQVFFVARVASFHQLKDLGLTLNDPRSCITFEDEEARSYYNELLEHKCYVCVRRSQIATNSGERAPKPKNYSSFETLAQHMIRDHRRHYCDLCVEHLKLFTNERQAYSRQDLKRHLLEGDLDDKSHKGHPRCDFCQLHYLDKDELYKHLRIDHFFCFICNQDNPLSRVMQYYATYEALKDHFRGAHFLCERGDCDNKRFVAFPTEIGFKAHCVEEHADGLSRQQVRQARNIALDFDTTPHDRNLLGADGRRGGKSDRPRRPRPHANPELDDYEDPPLENWNQPSVDTTSTVEFPTLVEEVNMLTSKAPLRPTPQYGGKIWSNPQNEEAFPSLCAPSAPPRQGAISKKGPTSAPNFRQAFISNVSNNTRTVTSVANNNRLNGGAVGGAKAKNPPRPNLNEEELFPSLPPGTLDLTPSRDPVLMARLKKPAPKQPNSWAMGGGGVVVTAAKTKKKKAPPSQQNMANGIVESAGENGNIHRSTTDPTRVSIPRSPVNNNNNNNTQQFTDLAEGDLKQSAASWGGAKKKQPPPPPPKKQPPPINKNIEEDFPTLGPAPKTVPVTPPGFGVIKPRYKGRKLDNGESNNRMKGGYAEPPYFNKRSTELLGMLKLLLNDAEKVSEFRTLSASYRRDAMSAGEYMEQCVQLFPDTQELVNILPEVIYLLPDIGKQNELLDSYVELRKSLTGVQPKLKEYTKCTVCSQVLSTEDVPSHTKLAH